MTNKKILKCIYCNDVTFEEGKGSNEHVILSSLGGKKASRNICCVKCNQKYGDEVDESLAIAYRTTSTMLGITTGRKKLAPKLRKVGKIGDRHFDILPNGDVSYSDPIINVEKSDTDIHLSVSARNKEELIEHLSRIYKSYSINEDKIETIKVKSVLTKSPVIHARFELGGSKQYRSVAKMLLTYITTLISPDKLRSGIFKNTINFIKNDDKKFPIWLETTQLKNYPKISKVNHRIFIFTSKDKKMALGSIEIYGHIRYSAILSNEWYGEDINKCYIIDPVSGSHENHDIPPIDSYPECSEDMRSLEGKTDILLDNFKRLNEVVENLQRDRAHKKIAEDIMRKYHPDSNNNEELSDEKLTLMVNEIKGRFLNLHFGQEYEEEVIIQKDDLTRKM